MRGPEWLPRATSLPPEPVQCLAPSSPLMDDFKFDAFGLYCPSETSVTAVDAELELLLELCPGKERGVRLTFLLQGLGLPVACISPGESVFLITLVLSF